MLNESLINGHNKTSTQHKLGLVGSIDFKSKDGRHVSFANAIQGGVSGSKRGVLKGWGCRSWDVYAAPVGYLQEALHEQCQSRELVCYSIPAPQGKG